VHTDKSTQTQTHWWMPFNKPASWLDNNAHQHMDTHSASRCAPHIWCEQIPSLAPRASPASPDHTCNFAGQITGKQHHHLTICVPRTQLNEGGGHWCCLPSMLPGYGDSSTCQHTLLPAAQHLTTACDWVSTFDESASMRAQHATRTVALQTASSHHVANSMHRMAPDSSLGCTGLPERP
jgi:hypothetical protein